jgi:predicted MFS family arabinose efflux permease
LLASATSSLGAPLIPTLSHHFHVSVSTAQWSLTITFLAGSVTAPLIGRLGDGPRRREVIAAVLFSVAIGTVLCALPLGFAGVLVGRAAQGVGLGVIPLTMGVARDNLSATKAKSTIATLSVTAIAGTGLGYPLMALITEHLGFQVAFVVAAGLNLVAAILVVGIVPPSTNRASHPIDRVGAVLLVLSVGGLVLGISQSSVWGFTSPLLWIEIVASLVLLIVWVRSQLRAEHPLVDVRLSRQRVVLAANVTGLLAGVGMYILVALIMQYAQTPNPPAYGLGASLLVAGLIMVPVSVISFFSTYVVEWIGRWMPAVRIMPVGVAIVGAAQVMFAGARSSLWEIFVIGALLGLGVGCSFAVMPRIIVRAVPPEETSSALAMNQVLRTIGYTIGSSLAAAVLSAHEHGGNYPTDSGYTVGALAGVGLCLVAVFVAALLPGRGAGRSVAPAAFGGRTLDERTLETGSVESAVGATLTYEPE